MPDFDISPDHQHRTRPITKKEAKRQRTVIPIILFVMVLLGIGIGWAAFKVSEGSLDAESVVRLLRNKYIEVQQGPSQITVDSPEGEQNPKAMVDIEAFAKRTAGVPMPKSHSKNPVRTGLQKILWQAGEPADFVPKSLEEKVKEAVERLKASRKQTVLYRRQKALRAEVQPILDELNIPPFVMSITWIESNTFADYEDVQGQRLGLWALSPEVARKHGMDLSSLPDPRLDAKIATQAARSYLVELFHRGGGQSWLMALLAYHEGPALLDSLMPRRQSWKPEQLHLLHWQREKLLPLDSRRYIYDVLAAAVLYEEAVDFNLTTIEDN